MIKESYYYYYYYYYYYEPVMAVQVFHAKVALFEWRIQILIIMVC